MADSHRQLVSRFLTTVVMASFFSGCVHGNGTARELEVQASQEGCAKGDSSRCMEAGRADVLRQEARAAGYFKIACDLGRQAGCFHHGQMLEWGRGIGQDVSGAKRMYEKLCAAGIKAGC